MNHQIFNFVAGELEKMYVIEDSLSQSKPELKDAPFDSLKNKDLADHLDDTFARFNDGSEWTVGYFIKKLSIGP